MSTQAPESSYRIGDVAGRVGVTTRTIRYYEELGLLGTPLLGGGHRAARGADPTPRPTRTHARGARRTRRSGGGPGGAAQPVGRERHRQGACEDRRGGNPARRAAARARPGAPGSALRVRGRAVGEAPQATEAAGRARAEVALMRIRWFGQSTFQISGERTVFIDPFGALEGLAERGLRFDYPPVEGVEADLLLVTHEHVDHNAVEVIGGSPAAARPSAASRPPRS